MQRNLWVKCIILLINLASLAGFVLPAQAKENNFHIDFGKVEPYEETVVERSLLTRLTFPNYSGVIVEADPYLINSEGRKISIHRLNLAVNNQLFELGELPLRIKKSQLSSGNILNFLLKLKLNSQDAPGIYEGRIMIRLDAENSGKLTVDELMVEINVEVKPWVRIESSDKVMILDRISNDNSSLQNTQPLEVRVASNTDWVLYVAVLKSGASETNDDIPLDMKADAASGVQLESVLALNCKGGMKIIAMGSRTTLKGYWNQIDLAVMLKDILKYSAGRYDFDLQFTIDLWSNHRR